MKNIFVCTDFSECSDNALRYAVGLAQETSAQITLFHGYLVTTATSSSTYFHDIESATELASSLEKETIQKMEKNVAQYKDLKYHDNVHHGSIKFSFLVRNGLPEDIISEFAKIEDADLIVLGTKGKSAVERILLGSVTHAIIGQDLPCPVLAVPKEVSYSTPKHIVFASQFSNIEFETVDHLIENWGNLFDAHITCLHVDSPNAGNHNVDQFKKKYFFTPFSRMDYEQFTSDNITASIDAFLNRKNVDIIAVLKYQRDFFDSLFHHSRTNDILRQTKLPILVYATTSHNN